MNRLFTSYTLFACPLNHPKKLPNNALKQICRLAVVVQVPHSVSSPVPIPFPSLVGKKPIMVMMQQGLFKTKKARKGVSNPPPATTTNCSPVQDRTGRTVVRENKEEEEGHGAAIQEEKEGTIPNSPEIAMHSVTRLRGTGIIFETKDSTKLTDIEFKEGKLLIPPLLIHDSTKLIFLNLMAFEQCRLHCENYITSYISFMDELINTPKDVEHLIEKRIIVHYLGSEKDVATLFNNIRKEIAIDPSNSYLLDVSQKLNKHYQQKWPTWKAILKHEYLKNPWKIISLVAAGLLILLTAAQTIYTMLSYHFPKT